MAVNVQQISPSGDGSMTDVYVEAGSHFEVVEGALVVLDTVDGAHVALFAAGSWLSAQVED